MSCHILQSLAILLEMSDCDWIMGVKGSLPNLKQGVLGWEVYKKANNADVQFCGLREGFGV